MSYSDINIGTHETSLGTRPGDTSIDWGKLYSSMCTCIILRQ